MTNNQGGAEFVVVTTTHETEVQARALAAMVVGARLAACAQVYQVGSVYWWEGEVRQAEEWRIDLKTRAELARQVEEFVTERHSYETPELLVVPVVGGGAGYLDWLRAETSGQA
ncbi:divalent-cation tolerance protein CutA [Kitasatospora sp. NPDC002227]|uniref:divalent-cation tolerance protein CutA n=1 Tax=Kitasatospora sp. NPDC002227 TaxID=3154773 RepID=UPI003322B40D